MLIINNIEIDVLKCSMNTEFNFIHGYNSIKMDIEVINNDYNYLALNTIMFRRDNKKVIMIDEKIFNLVNSEIYNIRLLDNIKFVLRCDYMNEHVDKLLIRKYKLRNIGINNK